MLETVGMVFAVVVLIGVAVAGSMMSKKMSGAAAVQMMGGAQAVAEQNRVLFEQTGYQHAAILGQPLQAQLAYSANQATDPMKGVHLVRDAQGLRVHFKTEVTQTASGVAYSAAWHGDCQPAFGMHLVDRSLMGAAGKKRNRAYGIRRDITPLYQPEVQIAVPALGQRFALYTTDPARAMGWLMKPEVQQRLTSLPSVELSTSPQGITLNDPMMDNLRPGGSTAQMLAQTPEQRSAHMLAVHQNVAGLLHGLALHAA